MNEQLFDTGNIKDLLEIWKSRAKPVVIWAGAGLSAPARLPTWTKLRDDLTKEASTSAATLPQEARRRHLQNIEAIRRIASPWKAFELLEDLGAASFQGFIRKSLVEGHRCAVPPSYKELWDLEIKGILTLNIDGLASRGFRESKERTLRLYERSGFEMRTLLGTITDNNSRFIANLHGSFDDATGWVFTERKLNALLNDPSYSEFVRDCVKYTTIVLLGVSAQDQAVIHHFQRTMLSLPNSGPHFWITSSDQHEAAVEAEKAGIRTTLYSNNDGKHSFIGDFLRTVQIYSPTTEPAEPVQQLTTDPATALPPPNELIRESPNFIRSVLNSKATEILGSEGDSTYADFDSFCKDYSRAIHATTFFSQKAEDDANKIGSFHVDEYVKEGGFAKVWYGSSKDGEPVAIKVFRHEIRENPDLLKAFRRGVRSMRLLQARHIPGVVRFIEASEIPPVVVMEWIDGVTLYDAVKHGGLKGWRAKIKAARELAQAIYAVHNTPERIVHRDIRPQNIMFRDYWLDPTAAEMVVLDFDLSWHLGALEKSVYVSGGTSYLAPEQLKEKTDASTRSAAVDSFGFGMTLYFIISSMDPQFFAHIRDDWSFVVGGACQRESCREWRSLPKRVARLIAAATLDQQSKRMTFGQIVAELDRLWVTLDNPQGVRDLSLIAEEIFSRVDMFSSYVPTESGGFRYASPSHITFEIASAAREAGISISFSFLQAGHEKYKILENLGDEFTKIKERFSRQLNVSNNTCNINNGSYHVVLTIDFRYEADFVEKFCTMLVDVSNRLINVVSSY